MPTASLSRVILKYHLLFLLSGALLLGLTVIFPQLGILSWIALIPSMAVILIRLPDPSIRLRKLWETGFLFFFAYYLVNFHWFLYMYPLDFTGMSKPVALLVVAIAWFGLSAFQALGAAFVFLLTGLALRSEFISKKPLLHPVIFASLWVAWEWFQANSGWSGVPWARVCLSQASFLPALQSAAWFGSYFVSFLIILVGGLLAYVLLYADKRKLAVILAASLFLGNLGAGIIRMLTFDHGDTRVSIAVIQGNLSSREKWGDNATEHALTVYGDYTREAAEAGAEIVIWPETAIPVNVDTHSYTGTRISRIAESCGVTVLAGVFTDHPETGEDYNSIVVYLPNGQRSETVFNKRNLVPFGEFVPFRELVMTVIPPLAEIGMLDRDLLAGEDSYVFDLDQASIGSLICFDSIYETNALDSVRNGAELLAVSTNDSWFKDSRGVWMHNAQSQLRAIETGRWVVRSANTGVSSVISAVGRVEDKLDALQAGYVLADVTLQNQRTLYSHIGNLFPILCLTFGGMCVLLVPAEKLMQKKR